MSDIKPWVYGPFELLQHAEGHLKASTDCDKRLALISYDNTIEVCITTFLQLHPTQRSGQTFRRTDVENWLRNYHTKLEFLEDYVSQLGQPMKSTRDEIIWYHQLRNELYHSGNGLVPAEYNLRGIREAAIWVFSILFDVDVNALLTSGSTDRVKSVPQEQQDRLSGKMTLVQSFIEFETTLYATLKAMGVLNINEQHLAINRAWVLFARECTGLPNGYENTVMQARKIRNTIVHGGAVELSEEDLIALSSRLDQVTEYLRNYVFSVDILSLLKERYPGWIRPDIKAVRLINREHTIFLETVVQKDFYTNVELEDLSFISDLPEELLGIATDEDEERYKFFSETRTAQENARRFVNELDPGTIYHTLDLFVDGVSMDDIRRMKPLPGEHNDVRNVP